MFYARITCRVEDNRHVRPPDRVRYRLIRQRLESETAVRVQDDALAWIRDRDSDSTSRRARADATQHGAG